MNSDNEVSLEDEQGINDEDESMLDDSDEENGVDSEEDREDWYYCRDYFDTLFPEKRIHEIFQEAMAQYNKKRGFDQKRKKIVITKEIEKLCSTVGKLLFATNNRRQYWARFARLYEPGAHRRDYKAQKIEDWKQKDLHWSTYFHDDCTWKSKVNKKEDFLDHMFGLNKTYFEYPFFGIQLSLARKSSFGYLFAPEPGREEYKDRRKETNRRRKGRMKDKKQEERGCQICLNANRPCDESSICDKCCRVPYARVYLALSPFSPFSKLHPNEAVFLVKLAMKDRMSVHRIKSLFDYDHKQGDYDQGKPLDDQIAINFKRDDVTRGSIGFKDFLQEVLWGDNGFVDTVTHRKKTVYPVLPQELRMLRQNLTEDVAKQIDTTALEQFLKPVIDFDGDKARLDFEFHEFFDIAQPIWKFIDEKKESSETLKQPDLNQLWGFIGKRRDGEWREFLESTEEETNSVSDDEIAAQIDSIYENKKYYSPIGKLLTSIDRQEVLRQSPEWKKTWVKLSSIEMGDLNLQNRQMMDKLKNMKVSEVDEFRRDQLLSVIDDDDPNPESIHVWKGISKLDRILLIDEDNVRKSYTWPR